MGGRTWTRAHTCRFCWPSSLHRHSRGPATATPCHVLQPFGLDCSSGCSQVEETSTPYLHPSFGQSKRNGDVPENAKLDTHPRITPSAFCLLSLMVPARKSEQSFQHMLARGGPPILHGLVYAANYGSRVPHGFRSVFPSWTVEYGPPGWEVIN